jgi:hypothetical protein
MAFNMPLKLRVMSAYNVCIYTYVHVYTGVLVVMCVVVCIYDRCDFVTVCVCDMILHDPPPQPSNAHSQDSM